MPASSVPFVALVVAMFGVFMISLGAVSIRLVLADRREARLARAKAAAVPPVQAVFPADELARAA